MANYKEDIVDIEMESGVIYRSWLNKSIGMGDIKANRFGVRLFRNGEAENISSCTCEGFFMRPDGTNLLIQGSTYTAVSGNKAYVTLPQDCYAYEGQFTLAIKVISSGDGITTTVRIVDGMVNNTGETGAVSPTSTIPTSAEIIAAYNQAVAVIGGSVRHDIVQSLTDAQKLKARENIDALKVEDGMRYVGVLRTGTNLDSLISETIYYVEARNGDVYNAPVNENGIVQTLGDNGYVSQQIYVTTIDGQNKIYTRRHITTGWGEWSDISDNYVGILSESDDLNDLLADTIYYKPSFQAIHGPADESSAMVYTFGDMEYVALQMYIGCTQSKNRVFIRRHLTSGWDDWDNLKNNYIGVMSSGDDLDDLMDGAVYFKPNGSGYPNTPSERSGLIFNVGDYSYVGAQLFLTTWPSGNQLFMRRKLSNGFGKWQELIGGSGGSTKEISILFVGNSLTQDGIAYLPYILTNFFPEIAFKFYMWYNGGYTLVEQYTAFTNNTPAATFSVAENTASWTNYSGTKTMASILESYKFDIVCLQGYYNYTTNTDDETAWNNCRDYIQANYDGGNALEFISLFHAPKRDVAETVFARTKYYNAKILQNTIGQDMIPIGIAVYRALSTDLDSLGDEGHLSPDGTHTQEGLPCLLQTYTALCWLLDKLSINKSIYGFPFKMTTAIYNTINVPGPNLGTGVIEGTDAQNLLAQEVAIKAYKEGKSFVMNNIFPDNQ